MTRPRPRVLLCDDEPNLRKVLGALLEQEGYEIHAENDGAAALARVRASPSGTFDAVISDLRMPKLDGMGLLRALVAEDPHLPVILLTAHGTVDSAVEAVKLGAFDYLEKPFDRDQIRQVLQRAAATRARTGASVGHAPRPKAADRTVDAASEAGIVGSSPALQEIRSIIAKIADTPSTVLITGESGTGKELVARALHLGSSRRDGPFIRVNCAAIPAGLVESELFGHERGAFTGAVSSRAGRFELADKGTLFLDEVSEIPLEIQVKLLRSIQESEFERVGGVKTQRVDVRLVAATNRDLEADIRDGRFREDLYYRLNVVPIRLAPLRDRPEEIPALVEHFVQRCNARLGKEVREFAPEALVALERHFWPGNIRELENLVERMVLFASGPRVEVDELPDPFATPGDRPAEDGGSEPAGTDAAPGDGQDAEPETDRASERGRPRAAGLDPSASASARLVEGGGSEWQIRLPLSSLGLDLKEAVKTGSRLLEEALIREALRQTEGNVTRSARLLGISRRSLQSKMKELGLRDDE